MAVTCIAAWFITANPRLSYFGTQLALAFYIIHLSAPLAAINLALARDNVVGILLGLLVMWIVYNGVRSKPAAVVMKELLVSNLQLMGKLATPWPADQKIYIQEIRTLREKIAQNFSAIDSQADGVNFETGRLANQASGFAIGFSACSLAYAACSLCKSRCCSTTRPSRQRNFRSLSLGHKPALVPPFAHCLKLSERASAAMLMANLQHK